MIFGQNYFDSLTSRIGGAGGIWNRHGLSNVNSRSKTNTIKAMNEAFNTTANKLYMADTNVADGAVKVENAGRKLS